MRVVGPHIRSNECFFAATAWEMAETEMEPNDGGENWAWKGRQSPAQSSSFANDIALLLVARPGIFNFQHPWIRTLSAIIVHLEEIDERIHISYRRLRFLQP